MDGAGGALLNSKVNAEEVLKSPKWPEKWPFYDDDFNRMDETSDGDFYSQPRLVYHIGAWSWCVVVSGVPLLSFRQGESTPLLLSGGEEGSASLRRAHGAGICKQRLVGWKSMVQRMAVRQITNMTVPVVLCNRAIWGHLLVCFKKKSATYNASRTVCMYTPNL